MTEPLTKAGREFLTDWQVGELDLVSRMQMRDRVLAIEAEAAALEWEPMRGDHDYGINYNPATRLPESARYSNDPTHGYHTTHGRHDCREYVVGQCAILAIEAEAAAPDVSIEALREALAWAMAPNPRYEGRHRTEPRCAEFMPTDAKCNCGYTEAAAALAPQPSVE